MKPPMLIRSRAILGAALTYFVVALACARTPLLNYLGYESSLVIALSGSIISGLLTIQAVRRSLREGGLTGWTPVRIIAVWRKSLLLNLELLLIPLGILAANALIVKNCSLPQGVLFFVLLPVISVWFSVALGLLSGIQRRRARILFVLFMGTTFCYALALGYLTPAIFSFNFFYGFFPGFSYDELLTITGPMLSFRLFTILVGVLLVWLAVLSVRFCRPDDPIRARLRVLGRVLMAPHRRSVTLTSASVLLLLYLFRCDLGWESTAGYVQGQLGGKYESAHVTLYYSPSSVTAEEIRQVAADHEFRLAQVSGFFRIEKPLSIVSYIYPTIEVKRRLTGTGLTNIAKPWRREVHLAQQSVPDVLKHEIAHVVAGTFGVPLINASLSTGLVEGVAMAVEGEWGNRSLHQSAAAMVQAGIAPEISDLMSFTGFVSHSAALSYVLAGSFCLYLVDSYGIRPLMQVYRSGDYDGAYGRPLSSLIGEWRTFLSRIRIRENDRDYVNAVFRHPTIFGKVCARVIAEQNRTAWEKFSAKEYASARDEFREAFAEGGGLGSLAGYLRSSHRLGDYPAVSVVWTDLVLPSANPWQYLPLGIYAGDAFWALGDTARARTTYEQLRAVDLSVNLTEAAEVRLLAMRTQRFRNAYREYLLADLPDSLRVRMLDSLSGATQGTPLAHYLLGRVYLRMGKWTDAARFLESLDLSTLSPGLEALRLRSIGQALFFSARYEKARAAFWSSLNTVKTESALLEVSDWIDRCTWMGQYGG